MSVSHKQSHIIVYSGDRAAYYKNGGLVESGPQVSPSAILEHCRKSCPCLFEERRTADGVKFPRQLRDLPAMRTIDPATDVAAVAYTNRRYLHA